MAEKDLHEKLLEDYPDVFADILNVLLFQANVLNPDYLENTILDSIYKTAQGKAAEQRRDVIKLYKKGQIVLCTYGLENQSDIDWTIPIRLMNYDAASYMEQVKRIKSEKLKLRKKINEAKRAGKTVTIEPVDTRIYPVITVVLNFSNKRWGDKRSLKDIMDIPEELEQYVSDYRIHVFDIAYLSEETIDLFQSDFKIVADYFRQSRVNDRYDPPTDVIDHVSEVMELLTVFSGDGRFKNAVPEILRSRYLMEGGLTMCKFIDAAENKGIAIGEERGFKKGRASILQVIKDIRNGMSDMEISALRNVPLEDVKETRMSIM